MYWFSKNQIGIKTVLPLLIRNKKRLAFVLAVVTALGLVVSKLEEYLVSVEPEVLIPLTGLITGQA
jgi:hypothetical protein